MKMLRYFFTYKYKEGILNKYISIIIMLLMFGCASPSLYIVDQNGRQMPTPSYTMYSMDSRIKATFYYYEQIEKRDLDGTLIQEYKFIKMEKIYFKPDTNLKLTIEIQNLSDQKYEVWDNTSFIQKNGSNIKRYGLSAFSNQPYRVFTFILPTDEKLKEVTHSIEIRREGIPLIKIGEFKYFVK